MTPLLLTVRRSKQSAMGNTSISLFSSRGSCVAVFLLLLSGFSLVSSFMTTSLQVPSSSSASKIYFNHQPLYRKNQQQTLQTLFVSINNVRRVRSSTLFSPRFVLSPSTTCTAQQNPGWRETKNPCTSYLFNSDFKKGLNDNRLFLSSSESCIDDMNISDHSTTSSSNTVRLSRNEKNELELHEAINAIHNNDDDVIEPFNNVHSENSIVQRGRQSIRKFVHRSYQAWMELIRRWKIAKKGRSLLMAAVLAFSVITVSTTETNLHQKQYSPSSTAVSHTQEIHRIVPFTRGGGGGGGGSGSGLGSVSSFFDKSTTTMSLDNLLIKNIEDAVEEGLETAGRQTGRTIREAAFDLHRYIQGPKADTLLLLLATALVTPLSKKIGMSPILGFLTSGMLMGPNGFGLISGIHTTETLAELGIVFFLFEMGIELSFQRLLSMKRDVFGLGLSQFLLTALAIAGVGGIVGGLPANACVVLGGGIALSSSAFVLQIMKDKNQLATRFGKASFGVLLFQDLAVVPLLVVTPILAGGQGVSMAGALGSALIKAGLALGAIALSGRFILNPLFKTVAGAQSQEAFLGVVLLTVLSMSFLTEGLGLSNTLGAFLAGVLLSETKYRYQVEADIAPFRGVLLGLFFVTVGFEIDLKLIASNLPLVSSLVVGILSLKAIVTTLLSLAFGLSLSTSQQTGLILSQGGEFAFVAFGLARSLGILDAPTTKLMLTSVSLTMASTPFMAALGQKIAKRLEESSDFSHYLGQDRDANEIKESTDFTVVVGYGAVGKVVCDLLDRKFIKYVGLDVDPNKVIQARNIGLPVFYGDIGRQEVAEAFNVGKASAVVVCIADRAQANRALIALRRWYPDLKIFARAVNADHASRLQNTLNVAAMVPILPEDNLLLTLPFGGAVMKALGVPTEEVNAILESKRKEVLSGRGLDRNEEEVALLQLGIETTSKVKSSSTSEVTDLRDKNVNDKKSGVSDSEIAEAAAERRKAAEAKSPFVAQVIEEICPGSAAGDDEEPCITPSSATTTVVTKQVIDAEIENEISISMITTSNGDIANSDLPQKVAVDE